MFDQSSVDPLIEAKVLEWEGRESPPPITVQFAQTWIRTQGNQGVPLSNIIDWFHRNRHQYIDASKRIYLLDRIGTIKSRTNTISQQDLWNLLQDEGNSFNLTHDELTTHLTQMGERTFRDVNNKVYIIPRSQPPLHQEGHKALWRFGPGSIIATWDSYVILGLRPGTPNDLMLEFDQINTVAQAMDAYRDFRGLPS